jgi:hypothetical protein
LTGRAQARTRLLVRGQVFAPATDEHHEAETEFEQLSYDKILDNNDDISRLYAVIDQLVVDEERGMRPNLGLTIEGRERAHAPHPAA